MPSARSDKTDWLIERLPAVASVITRSPGISKTCSLRKIAMLSTPALVRVSAIIDETFAHEDSDTIGHGWASGAFVALAAVAGIASLLALDARLRSSTNVERFTGDPVIASANRRRIKIIQARWLSARSALSRIRRWRRRSLPSRDPDERLRPGMSRLLHGSPGPCGGSPTRSAPAARADGQSQ